MVVSQLFFCTIMPFFLGFVSSLLLLQVISPPPVHPLWGVSVLNLLLHGDFIAPSLSFFFFFPFLFLFSWDYFFLLILWTCLFLFIFLSRFFYLLSACKWPFHFPFMFIFSFSYLQNKCCLVIINLPIMFLSPFGSFIIFQFPSAVLQNVKLVVLLMVGQESTEGWKKLPSS